MQKDSLLVIRNFYRSFNKVRMIKSRRLEWAEYVARMEEDRRIFNIFLSGALSEDGINKSEMGRVYRQNGRVLEC